eukprot:TRINITY_DN39497_c0_g1_i1.p1 TRINITY_DN39497_c0_g1~~TRINITY_DN39497_c0_g1_i1.p1  ORF type:complete len:160 (-),score=45.29 TRINITY_DN39497_c0_g1_i1:137-616(-)
MVLRIFAVAIGLSLAWVTAFKDEAETRTCTREQGGCAAAIRESGLALIQRQAEQVERSEKGTIATEKDKPKPHKGHRQTHKDKHKKTHSVAAEAPAEVETRHEETLGAGGAHQLLAKAAEYGQSSKDERRRAAHLAESVKMSKFMKDVFEAAYEDVRKR